ncbi:hypothetical protein B0E33_03400 [Roseibium algicola]|jgi:hypothetical protein|uniref:Uncharacterized protein n=1 Tax=Roseibium algicola TaxID=2857014 RepID=A0ABM6HXG5_9HYPH|nr:hypothetical protein B0E33_03400 [Roseibium aggregatum]
MHLLRAQIRNILALLLIALMPVAAFSAAGDWSQISYPLEAQELNAELANLMNAARAPPIASANVMATGTAFTCSDCSDPRKLRCLHRFRSFSQPRS